MISVSQWLMNNDIFYGIALSLLKGIGDANAKMLISSAGSAEKLFRLSPSKLQKINGIGPKLAESFTDTYDAFKRAEEELKFIEKNNIETVFYYDKRYPYRLLNCPDAPLFIFYKGNVDFNKERFVNVVGTRHCTEYGKEITEKLIADLAVHNVNLVSGLAYGIDICAHKAALKFDIQNIAVLAHGLDRIYPNQHRSIVEKLQQNGAIVSDFLSGTNPDRQNFPSRNRIVAGMTDATIVIESAVSGGALITADIANSYNRDVYAFPGRADDEYSKGCLQLIKNHKANLVTDARDIIEYMNWDLESKQKKNESVQSQLFIELTEQERVMYEFLKSSERTTIDEIHLKVNLSHSIISSLLLQLEMKGIIVSLPGKVYKIAG
ncbi:MAG: DNA-processing protein DprA [Chitinophagales bacterium]